MHFFRGKVPYCRIAVLPCCNYPKFCGVTFFVMVIWKKDVASFTARDTFVTKMKKHNKMKDTILKRNLNHPTHAGADTQ